MFHPKRGAVVAVQTLLLAFLAASGVHAQFSIQDGFLATAGERFIVRGAAYSSRPIGFGRYDEAPAPGCRYARDLPLLAAAGANTVRTLELIDPEDGDFSAALDSAGLYWLADFPLDQYLTGTGAFDSPQVRERILADFLAYAAAWQHEPRLIGFVFGPGAGDGAASPASFFSLLEQAGLRLRESGSTKLLTTAVADLSLVGSFPRQAADGSLPALDFWSLDLTGRTSVADRILEAAGRTAKPVLVAAYGVDAFDAARGAEIPEEQSLTAEALARDVESLSQSSAPPVLGGLWAALVDEWWRGGPDASVHGTGGFVADELADGELNPAWLGLFRAANSGTAGLDGLRPRGAYFALARVWGRSPPAELTMAGAPFVSGANSGALGSGFGFTAPGALTSFPGEGLAFSARSSASNADLPPSLGTTAACVGGHPAGLLWVDEGEIRARAPEQISEGVVRVVAFRGGAAGNPAEITVRASAPTIFPGAVLHPGKPCPLAGANAGVRPGDSIEIYGTGLDASSSPVAVLNGLEIPVEYSGPLAGVAGAYQTNVAVPEDFPSGPAELRLVQNGSSSNRYDLAILYPWDEEDVLLSEIEPGGALIQAGGGAQALHLGLAGFNGFCDAVRFEVTGLPAGVRASIPVGLPGATLPLQIWAAADAPLAEDVPVTVRALAPIASTPERLFRVTVLPAQGDVRLRVVSGGWTSGEPLAEFQMEGRTLFHSTGGAPGRGFNFITIDATSGLLGPTRHFDTWASEEEARAMEDYLDSLPVGAVVLGAIADDGFLNLRDETFVSLRKHLGAELIDSLEYQDSWAIITRKGAARPMGERLTRFDKAEIELVLSFPME